MASSSLGSGIRRVISALFGTRTSPSPRADTSAGHGGAGATVEIDPRGMRAVSLGYAPTPNGQPDPGEIVWTWVPYEENDGRGKDRPVVIVATARGGFLAVQLTSKHHDGTDYLPLGPGPWDREGRPSWVILDRVFHVSAAGVRREASRLDRKRFERVASALRSRYGWR
ncbi:type II toxin-antitoxin system PemK/MazF family toxin [Glaciibacter flavus]|uniref:type II toxin-antitoxin system PemK/MazF family toxin n=1 Tax=Orlajensenia flava TaxID=2565934 RepID=UPI003B00E354